MHDALGNRNAADDQFKGAVLDEVAGIKAALALEREERVAEDDEIVQVSGRGCASRKAGAAGVPGGGLGRLGACLQLQLITGHLSPIPDGGGACA